MCIRDSFITLKPGEKHEVPIKEAYLLLTYFDRLRNGQNYEPVSYTHLDVYKRQSRELF